MDETFDVRTSIIKSRHAGWVERIRYAQSLLPHVSLVDAVLDDVINEIMRDDHVLMPAVDADPSPCIMCGSRYSSNWWKCCPRHTTETGPDVVCNVCAVANHPNIEPEVRRLSERRKEERDHPFK